MKKFLTFFIPAVFLVILDQWTKYLAVLHLKGTDGISLVSGIFKLQYLENRGMAFGMFQNKRIFFLVMTLAVLCIILFIYWKMPAGRHFLPLRILCSILCAGAVGNFIDRMVHHYVVDFFYFERINFPIFNVADCYVTVSAMVLLLLCFFYYKEEDFDFIFEKKKTDGNRTDHE